MIISVLERRSEIRLRRALGATENQIRTQFLAESILLSAIGGIVGMLAGAAATAVHASANGWAIVIPVEAWAGSIASAILIGAFAGLMPAIRPSRMPATVALRTVCAGFGSIWEAWPHGPDPRATSASMLGFSKIGDARS